MDTPLWVTVLVAALTAGSSYVAGIRPARIAARQAEADRDLARQERDDGREQWFIERIDKAWELCRSADEKDKRAGVRLLRAMIKEPGLTRLVSNILDEVAQEELGDELRDLRTAWPETGSLPDVDIVVVEATMAGNRRWMVAKPKAKIRVTRRQVELAQAKVEADTALQRTPDPLLVQIASAERSQRSGRLAG